MRNLDAEQLKELCESNPALREEFTRAIKTRIETYESLLSTIQKKETVVSKTKPKVTKPVDNKLTHAQAVLAILGDHPSGLTPKQMMDKAKQYNHHFSNSIYATLGSMKHHGRVKVIKGRQQRYNRYALATSTK